jgi:hypothetical protein
VAEKVAAASVRFFSREEDGCSSQPVVTEDRKVNEEPKNVRCPNCNELYFPPKACERCEDSLSISEARATAHFRQALDKIEAAQGLLGDAASLLCPVIGAVPQWRKLGKLYDTVKAAWHHVNNSMKGRRFYMDNCYPQANGRIYMVAERPTFRGPEAGASVPS